MSKLMIRDSPFVRLLKAVGLVSINPDGEIDHSAGADYISNHGFKPQYDSTTAMSVLAAFPFPYACVTAIATDLSSVPIRVYRGRGANAEQLDNHPLIDLLEQPSSRVSGVAFRRQIYTDATLVGNCYVLIAGNREPESLLRLHPSRITISPLQDGQPDKYIYAGGGQPTEYDYTQVLHMRSPSWSDDPTSLWGVGSVQPLHHDLMTEKAQSELAARTAATGQPTGILSPKADGDLWNKRQIDTLRQALEMQLSKGGSGILITGGQSEFTKLAFSPRLRAHRNAVGVRCGPRASGHRIAELRDGDQPVETLLGRARRTCRAHRQRVDAAGSHVWRRRCARKTRLQRRRCTAGKPHRAR